MNVGIARKPFLPEGMAFAKRGRMVADFIRLAELSIRGSMLVAMSGPDLIFYGAIAVAIIGLFAFPFLHQRKKRAEPPPVPVQPKVRQQVPPPPAPKPTPQKSAEQIFREAFPDMQVKPVFDHPFGVRAEACMLRDKTTRKNSPASGSMSGATSNSVRRPSWTSSLRWRTFRMDHRNRSTRRRNAIRMCRRVSSSFVRRLAR
jgi:hypothetical protein